MKTLLVAVTSALLFAGCSSYNRDTSGTGSGGTGTSTDYGTSETTSTNQISNGGVSPQSAGASVNTPNNSGNPGDNSKSNGGTPTSGVDRK